MGGNTDAATKVLFFLKQDGGLVEIQWKKIKHGLEPSHMNNKKKKNFKLKQDEKYLQFSKLSSDSLVSSTLSWYSSSRYCLPGPPHACAE